MASTLDFDGDVVEETGLLACNKKVLACHIRCAGECAQFPIREYPD